MEDRYLIHPEGPLPVLTIPDRDMWFRLVDFDRLEHGIYDASMTDGHRWDPTPEEIEQMSRFAWWASCDFAPAFAHRALVERGDFKFEGWSVATFAKLGPDRWHYRRATWTNPLEFSPRLLEAGLPLADLIEKIVGWKLDSWVAFCERHPLASEAA